MAGKCASRRSGGRGVWRPGSGRVQSVIMLHWLEHSHSVFHPPERERALMRTTRPPRWQWVLAVAVGIVLLAACGPRITGPTPAVKPIPLATSPVGAAPGAGTSASGSSDETPSAAASTAVAATSVIVSTTTPGGEGPAGGSGDQATAAAVAGVTVTPERPPASSPLPVAGDLTGVVWNWAGSTTASGDVTKVTFPDRYTMEFLPGNRVRLRADCNTGTGIYTPDGQSLSIQVGVMTKTACHPQSRASAFLQQIATVSTYELGSNGLTLALSSGDSMQFVQGKAGGNQAEGATSN